MSRKLSRAALALVVTPSVAFTSLSVPAYAAEVDQVSLNILGVTDFHGHIQQKTSKSGAVTEIGAGALACFLDKERQANPNTSFVSAGDNIGGSPFESSILKDKPTVEVLNAMGLEASAVGNHELDKGWDDLNGRVGVDGSKLAKFPYLAANMKGVQVAPSRIVEKDGVKIAYIGAITDTTNQLVSPAGIPGITFSKPIEAVNAEAARLKQQGQADVVIGLVHEGVTSEGFSKDVDAVIAGHTHQNRNLEGQPPVVQPANYGMLIGDIDVVFDKKEKRVVSVKTTNRTSDEVVKACNGEKDAEVEKIVQAAATAAKEEGQKVVATTRTTFFRGSNAGADSGSNRGTESTLNSMIADATLESVNKSTDFKADIGIMNAGGVREDLMSGEVTFSDAYAVQPFNNTLGVVDVTGAQFKKVLEQQWRNAAADERPVLVLGLSKNVEYTYDPTAPIGSRITSVKVDGKVLDENKTYRIAGNNFLLAEGDGFTGFDTHEGGSNKIKDTGLVDVDAFNKYLASSKDLAARTDQTSVGVHFVDANPAELTADQKVKIELSSLSYTTQGEPMAKTVKVSFAYEEGEQIKWAPAVSGDVDNTITNDNNETGKASLEVTVPANAVALRVKTDNGTDQMMPVNGAALPAGPTPGDNVPGSSDQPGSSDSAGSSKEQQRGFWAFLFGGLLSVLAGAGLLAWAYDNGMIPQWMIPSWVKLPKRILPQAR